MSTDYRLLGDIKFSELFDGRLDQYGVRENVVEGDTKHDARCLTDGYGYLWFYADEQGHVGIFSRHGICNVVGGILGAIATSFDIDIASEHQPQYWGFETKEEWDACWHKMAKEAEDRFYKQLLKFLRGEENDIRPGSVGMYKAELAKALIGEHPELASLDSKRELLDAIAMA